MQISPVRKNIYQKSIKLNKNNHTSFCKQKENFKSIYSTSNINFSGYYKIQKPEGFINTVDENWFQLPKIELEDGSIYRCQPDKTQLECAKALYDGESVIYDAPTGTGKTAVANWAITSNLQKHKKTYYTTPLIALANDKYREFSKIYGKENVGLLTGEKKINPHANILIMTTEIYNIQAGDFYKNPKNIGTVIFDEAHYLGDKERGNVWENSILKTPLDKINILLLSATVGNSDKIASWVQSLSSQSAVTLVKLPPEERYVPLVWYHYDPHKKNDKFIPVQEGEINLNQIEPDNLSDKQKRALEIISRNTFKDRSDDEYIAAAEDFKSKFWQGEDLAPDEKIENYSKDDFREILSIIYPDLDKDEIRTVAELLIDSNTRTLKEADVCRDKNDFCTLVNDLESRQMLPALIFKLSKKGCENIVAELETGKIDLTTEEEKKEIFEIIKKYEEKGQYLGKNFDINTLAKGYAYHHSGELPLYRKLIEDLFSKKLLKVVCATSTLSAGINMPARSVVMTDMTYQKYDFKEDDFVPVPLDANSFHQMAGRAGRRGIDGIGNVIFYNLREPKKNKEHAEKEKISENKLAYELLKSNADDIRSQFEPQWCSCADFWSENDTDEGLIDYIENSFKIFLSNNKKEIKEGVIKKFERYNTVLLKLGYIEKSKDGKIALTPKGRILTRCEGRYPLLLSSLICTKTLEDLSAFDLCQIAGSIASSNAQPQSEHEFKAALCALGENLENFCANEEYITHFSENNERLKSIEAPLKRIQNQCKIEKNKILNSNIFGAYTAYLWAILNKQNKNSVQNFKKITTNPDDKTKCSDKGSAEYKARSEFQRNTEEGVTYKTIAQTISILKQISRICDWALNLDECDTVYYKTLKDKALEAIDIINKPPFYDEFDI